MAPVRSGVPAVSGELEQQIRENPQLQDGPAGPDAATGPFSSRQLTRLDEAITLASRESGLVFSVYVGPLTPPTRRHAEALFGQLTDESVLIAVSPGQRTLHVVTGTESAKRLPNRACALAALTMRAAFSARGPCGSSFLTRRAFNRRPLPRPPPARHRRRARTVAR